MMEGKSLSEIVLEQAAEKDLVFYDKIVFFEKELELISDPTIRKFVEYIMVQAEPFWNSPASMVQGVHPDDEYTNQGMALHTKRVIKVLSTMISATECNESETDCLFAAAFLHDITKAVWKDETQIETLHDEFHPYTVESFVKCCQIEAENTGVTESAELTYETIITILRLIRCSHGPWSIVPETFPMTQLEKMLHMADMIATNLHYIVELENVENG